MIANIFQYVFIVFYSNSVDIICGQAMEDNKRLYTELFTNRDYNKEIRPIQDQSKAVEVSLDFSVTAIEQFNVRYRFIETSGYMFVRWTDSSLAWNASEYGGSNLIYIKHDVLWQPNILQYGEENPDRVQNVILYSNGLILQGRAGKYTTKCSIDVFLYPFDKHTCEIYFYSLEHIEIITTSPEIGLASYIENSEWLLESTACEVDIRANEFRVSGYRCFINVARRSTYGVVHVFLPAVCLSVLTILIFWLPVNCGERISFGITLFLAYTMTLSGLSNEIPRDSTKLPLYSYVLVIMNMTSAACVVFSVVVTRISLSTKSTIPTYLQNLVLCLNPSLRRELQNAEAARIQNIQHSNKTDETDCSSDAKVVSDMVDNITWSAAAQAVDNVIFAFVVVILLILLVIGMNYAF